MFKPSVLVVALLLSSTALWSAFVDGSLSITTALIRFLIAVPVAAAMVYAFGLVVRGNVSKDRLESSRPVTDEPEAGLEAG